MRSTILTLMTILAVSACADPGATEPRADGGSTGIDSPAPAPQPEPGDLTIRSTYSAGEGGILYIEGAMRQFVLLDADGEQVAHEKTAEGDVVVRDLAPGDYTLEADLRPCDGNCGYLDPPTDGCRAVVTVDGDKVVRVDFTVGRHCRITH
jgi:hypothetical protein